MPRRRKRPPQESIDSILLAISRRDDLDDDTMLHYFDRLDEEWETGAREKVLHLLRSNDAAAHSAAVMILSELATEDDLEELEDFVADPTVTDLAKLTLAPLLKELGSEMADDAILPYLNDPEAAMAQMQTRLLELVGQSELGVESILEDVMEMPVERRLAFIGWLGSSQDPRAANLLVPLLENPSTKVAQAAIEALEELGTIAAQQAIPALNYLISTSSNRAVKQRARAALGRLTMQSVPGVEVEAMQAKRSQRLPLHEARVSFIDGVGSQMIMLSWKRPDGLLKGVNLLYQDQWGIKDCYGTDEMDADHWASLVGQMEEQGFGSFRVPIEYARSLVTEARIVNKRTRHRLPVAFSIWRPFIEDEESHEKGSSAKAAPTALEPIHLTPETEQLAMQRGDELINMVEFSSWLFEPFESLQPYINRYWTNFALAELSHGNRGRRGRGRGGNKEISKEQQQFLEDAVSEAISNLIDEQWRTLYEVRMRRQGLLFEFAGRKKDVTLVQAVAAALHPNSGIPAQEQPFLRAMMRLSIQQGPIRMLAEALESGQLGTAPMSLLPLEED
jgi:HEAT repeats